MSDFIEFQAGRDLARHGLPLPNPVSEAASLGFESGLVEMTVEVAALQGESVRDTLARNPDILESLRALMSSFQRQPSSFFWSSVMDHVGLLMTDEKSLTAQTSPDPARVGGWQEQQDSGSTFFGIQFHWGF